MLGEVPIKDIPGIMAGLNDSFVGLMDKMRDSSIEKSMYDKIMDSIGSFIAAYQSLMDEHETLEIFADKFSDFYSGFEELVQMAFNDQ